MSVEGVDANAQPLQEVVRSMARPLAASTRVGVDYERFYRSEIGPLTALTAAITGSNLIAEDLAQEALLKAYKQWDRVGALAKPGAWTRRVAINQALSSRRRRLSELKAKLRLQPEPTLLAAPSHHAHVWQAVAELPGQQRAAIALHYLEDLPIDEIAEILSVSESTARVHLHRGRNALVTLLEEPS